MKMTVLLNIHKLITKRLHFRFACTIIIITSETQLVKKKEREVHLFMHEKIELTAAEREARAEYFRAWRRKNKEKVRAYNAQYWKRRAAQQGGGETDGEANV